MSECTPNIVLQGVAIQQTGPRTVIVPADPIEWSNSTSYEYLTLVSTADYGQGYVSKKDVPAGTPLTDTEYWIPVASFNAQVAQVQKQVAQIVSDLNDEIERATAAEKANASAASAAQTTASEAQTAASEAQTAAASAMTEAQKKAPIAHASANTTYGTGSASLYGHVKLSDSASSGSGAGSGVAATPLAVLSSLRSTRSPYGAKAVMFGDSNTLSTYTDATPMEKLNTIFGMNGTNYGVSGATFTDLSDYPTIADQISARDSDSEVTWVFFIGGINDYHYNDADVSGFSNAFAAAVKAAHAKYPNAVIVSAFDGGHQYPNGLMFDFMRATMQDFNFPYLSAPTADICLNDALWHNQNHYNTDGMNTFVSRIARTMIGSCVSAIQPAVKSSTVRTGLTAVEVIRVDPFNLVMVNEFDLIATTQFASQPTIASGTVLYTATGTMTSNAQFENMIFCQTPASYKVATLGFSNGTNNSGVITTGGPTVDVKAGYDINPSAIGAGNVAFHKTFTVV